MELASADDTAAKERNVLFILEKEEMPVIHVQHIALQEGATFFYPIQKVLKSIKV
jgi:hypothetical protein